MILVAVAATKFASSLRGRTPFMAARSWCSRRNIRWSTSSLLRNSGPRFENIASAPREKVNSGVPAHDERDIEFARKFDLPIVAVVQPTGDEPAIGFTGEGTAVNSPIINGLASAEAKKKITAWLEERGLGKRAINYKLRYWLFSRQRYWGEPFPIIWENGKHRA